MYRGNGTISLMAVAAAGAAFALGHQPAQSAQAMTPQARAEAAFQAMGGEKQEMVTSIVLKGMMAQWEPGESYSVADLTKPDGGTSTFTETLDRTKGYQRIEWVRPRAAGGTRNYAEIIMPDGGYVIGNDANGAPPKRTISTPANLPAHTMSAIRLTATLREIERNDVVLEMHGHPERISDTPAQTIAGKSYPAVQYRGDHGTFVVAFDPATNLPAMVRTRDFDQLMGDADFDESFSDWRDVGGLKIAHRMTYTLNGMKIFDTTLTDARVDIVGNSILPADTFAVPTAIRGKAPKPASVEKPPYQWILRRLASGFFLDSDSLYTDEGGSLALTDVAPNISLVTGGTHNTLIVATNTYLVAFDAPGDDGQSKLAIDLAKQKYPGKPFRYLVLTHHHIDHSGGLRAYVAEGASVVVGKGDGDFFRKVLSAPQNLNVNKPQGTVAPRVIEVADTWSVKDGGREIGAYVIDNPHVAGYLMPYVPDAKLAFITDLWNPGPPVAAVNPNMVAVVKGVEKWKLLPERFAGGHAAVGNYADLMQAVAAAPNTR
jgi:glyoxylase-like metal-dependent hydrolase (beta-lactamase superfamily II)